MANEMLCATLESKAMPGPGGCWLWRSSCQTRGYGQIKIAGRNWLAHRAMWTAARGPIPGGRMVLHRCDTPRCINPAHLFLGDAKVNHADAVVKDRKINGFPPGAQRKPRVRRFTDDQIRAIRSATGPVAAVAALCGTTASYVSRIRRGKAKALVPWAAEIRP